MADTTLAMQKISFQWDITNFDHCDHIINEFFESPQFFTKDLKFKSIWKLRLYPAGFMLEGNNKTIKKITNNISLLLLRADSEGSTFCTKHSISFLNRNGERIKTERSADLCEYAKMTESNKAMLKAANIIEIKNYTQRLLDDGVLSLLCELEIYDPNKPDSAVPEKHLKMHGSSLVIRNDQHVDLNLIPGHSLNFYLPYGNSVVGLTCYFSADTCDVSFRINDDALRNIKHVPITLIADTMRTTWNLIRSAIPQHTGRCINSDSSLKISARCMVDSTPNDASPNYSLQSVNKIRSDYRNMLSTQYDFGDISIVVNNKVIRAHQDILRNRCSYFAAMFNQEWRESYTKTVNITHFDYKTILALIEFIYYGGSYDENEEGSADPVELLKAAHMYLMQDLKNKCEQRLCHSLDKDNVFKYFALSENYDLPKLNSKARAFVSNSPNCQ